MKYVGASDFPEYRWWTDIQDCFVYLTLDGCENQVLAENLIGKFDELQMMLIRYSNDTQTDRYAQDSAKHIEAFLCALEQVLCLKHGIDIHPRIVRSRREFMESWKETTKSLGF